MNKFKLIISFIFALLTLVSCGRITDEETIWQLKSLPVVFSVISPAKTVQVSICKTVLQNERPDSIYYPTAKVYVCGEDKNWIELSRQSDEKAIYQDADNKIEVKEGKIYYLRVEFPTDTVSAQTIVPLQNSSITEAKFIVDTQPTEDYPYFRGMLYAKLDLIKNDPCILIALSDYIGTDNSTFLNQEDIAALMHFSDSIKSFDLKLITLDPYLSKFWVSKELESQKRFFEGDISVFLGSYNGLLPPYSNIINGVGLFGSYTTYSKTVNIFQQ